MATRNEGDAMPAERARHETVFAELLDRLAYEPGRNNSCG